MTPQQSRRVGRIVFLVMLGTMGALLLWDAVAQFGFGLKYTVSWAIWQASVSAPIIPALTGLVIGIFFSHLYWSGHADSQKEIQARDSLLRRSMGYVKKCCACPVFPEAPCLACDLLDDIEEILAQSAEDAA